jgi:hypothetical protein
MQKLTVAWPEWAAKTKDYRHVFLRSTQGQISAPEGFWCVVNMEELIDLKAQIEARLQEHMNCSVCERSLGDGPRVEVSGERGKD